MKHSNPKRRGFTLIELMIVIAIIGVLVGLLSAAVVKATIVAQQARNRNDIMQLEMAVQAFKTQYGFYPPSRMLLCETFNDYSALPTSVVPLHSAGTTATF